MRDTKEYVIFDAVTPIAISSSTDATPVVVTTGSSHGFVTGDVVMINGHSTNIAANGIYRVTVLTATTFSLQNVNTGANIAGSGGGAGSGGVVTIAPKIPLIKDFRDAILSVMTTGTATLTARVMGSIGRNNGDMPNFGGTISPSNPYQAVQIIDLDTGAAVNGATGIVASAADVQKQYEVNVNALSYLTVGVVSYTQGAITVKLLLANNE